MLLDVSADDLRRDLVTHRTSTIAIFPECPAPQAPFDSRELTKDGPGTQTLEACHDLRNGVPGREWAKDMDRVGTDRHFLKGYGILLRNIGTRLPCPLLALPLQDVWSSLGRPD